MMILQDRLPAGLRQDITALGSIKRRQLLTPDVRLDTYLRFVRRDALKDVVHVLVRDRQDAGRYQS
jgi:hypothetical protein